MLTYPSSKVIITGFSGQRLSRCQLPGKDRMIAIFLQPAQVPLQLFRRHHHWVVSGRVHRSRHGTSRSAAAGPFQLRGSSVNTKIQQTTTLSISASVRMQVQHRSFLLSPWRRCQIPPSIIIKSVLSGQKRNKFSKKFCLTEEYSRDWKEKILCTGENF